MIVGQITDFHVSVPGADVDQRYRTAEHLEAAVAHLNGLQPRPDVVVADRRSGARGKGERV